MAHWITVSEAAKLAGRSTRNIYRWIDSGRLRTITGDDGCALVDGRQVLEVEPTVRRGRPRGTARPTARRA